MLPSQTQACMHALPTHQGEGTFLCTCHENPHSLLSCIDRLCLPPSSLLTDTLARDTNSSLTAQESGPDSTQAGGGRQEGN